MDVNVRHQQVIVTRGDSRSAADVASLLQEDAEVTVICPTAVATIEDLAARGLITWHAREITGDDIAGAFIVIGDARPAAGSVPRGAGLPDEATAVGSVTLIGGGPGDPELMTIAGRSAIETADVIVADRLCPPAALAWARSEAEIVDVGKIPGGRATSQDEIQRILIEHARAGRRVARYKGGDPFVFGRGGEELIACAEAGVRTKVIPGVSSALAVPAIAGIPVTHRGLTQAFTVVTGHVPPGDPGSTVDWQALACSGTTIVILMGVRALPHICAALMDAGMEPNTPVAVIADGGLPSQRIVSANLENIADRAEEAAIRPPAVTVIGAVAALDLHGLAPQPVAASLP